MSGYVIWILLISIWNIILFYGRDLGVNVILFMIPLLIFMYVFLKKNDRIKNVKGLLFIVPIIMLSTCYLVFNNELFQALNCLVIPLLFILMYIYTIKPTFNLWTLLRNIGRVLFTPFEYIGRFYRVSTYKISEKIKISDKTKKVFKSLLIVVPIVLIIISLLSSADMIFGNIFDTVFDKIVHFFKYEIFDEIIGKICSVIILFFAIGCTCLFLLHDYSIKEDKVKENKKPRELLTMKLLLSALNVIYIIFDFIQVRSLLLHKVGTTFTYAEYARRGFFELMVVSLINLAIILISKRYETKDNEKEYRYVEIMNVIMVLLTIVIIVSSFLRMHLYEAAYGYTTLRLLVFATLITEAILMIPTIMYIFNSDIKVLRSYIIIITCAYLVLNFINIDYMVARRNVNRYYANNKIDIDYLENYYTDNVPVLIELYKKTDDVDMKRELENYLRHFRYENETDSYFEFNLSKYRALKLLDKNKIYAEKDYSNFE